MTGVQTCALPICRWLIARWIAEKAAGKIIGDQVAQYWGVFGPAIIAYVTTYGAAIKQFLTMVYNNPAVHQIVDFITSFTA